MYKDSVKAHEVFPYRYGSYYIYEANNATNQFKVATFINITSNEVANFYPQYVYDAILKCATGNKDFIFKTTNVPFPKAIRSVGHQADANGIFLAFVAGISFSLIPASIISRIVHEKEIGLLQLQRVSGANMKAYWFSFFIFDVVKAYLSCFLTWLLITAFELDYH